MRGVQQLVDVRHRIGLLAFLQGDKHITQIDKHMLETSRCSSWQKGNQGMSFLECFVCIDVVILCVSDGAEIRQ